MYLSLQVSFTNHSERATKLKNEFFYQTLALQLNYKSYITNTICAVKSELKSPPTHNKFHVRNTIKLCVILIKKKHIKIACSVFPITLIVNSVLGESFAKIVSVNLNKTHDASPNKQNGIRKFVQFWFCMCAIYSTQKS